MLKNINIRKVTLAISAIWCLTLIPNQRREMSLTLRSPFEPITRKASCLFPIPSSKFHLGKSAEI